MRLQDDLLQEFREEQRFVNDQIRLFGEKVLPLVRD